LQQIGVAHQVRPHANGKRLEVRKDAARPQAAQHKAQPPNRSSFRIDFRGRYHDAPRNAGPPSSADAQKPGYARDSGGKSGGRPLAAKRALAT
jgi:hypothetical protein